jgi:hypothetical protein
MPVTLSKTGTPDPEQAPAARERGGKRRYEKPRLIDYGPVSKLTQTGGITTPDNKTMFRVCL